MPAVPPCRLCFQGEGQLSCPFSEDRKQTALPKRPNFSRIALCTLPVARKKKKKKGGVPVSIFGLIFADVSTRLGFCIHLAELL